MLYLNMKTFSEVQRELEEDLSVTDHYGRKFRSLEAMCTHYGINKNEYLRHKENGESVEWAILNSHPKKDFSIPMDHHGNVFPSWRALTEAYGMSYETYRSRRNRGWSLEKSLEEPVRKCKKKYSSITEDNDASDGDDRAYCEEWASWSKKNARMLRDYIQDGYTYGEFAEWLRSFLTRPEY